MSNRQKKLDLGDVDFGHKVYKYHYKIVDKATSDVVLDSKYFCTEGNGGTDEFGGWDTQKEATTFGENRLYGKYPEFSHSEFMVEVYEA